MLNIDENEYNQITDDSDLSDIKISCLKRNNKSQINELIRDTPMLQTNTSLNYKNKGVENIMKEISNNAQKGINDLIWSKNFKSSLSLGFSSLLSNKLMESLWYSLRKVSKGRK